MSEGQGFARRVTLENLGAFAPLLRRSSGSASTSDKASAYEPDESPDLDAANEKLDDQDLREAEAQFSGESFKIPAHYSRRTGATGVPRVRERQPGSRSLRQSTGSVPQAIQPGRGPLLWRKANLPASDVQRQPGNPTGGIRLTQARFRVDDAPIDQTTYFRDIVFGSLAWKEGKKRPYREDATATFDVTILHEHLGRYELTISHKPSGEAGQRNYTTILHWGPLAETIRDRDLVGRTFSLYAPPPGQIEPYFIEISGSSGN